MTKEILTVPEIRDANLHIEGVIGEMAVAGSTEETRHGFLEIVDRINDIDLEAKRDMMVEACLTRPYESLFKEFATLTELYPNRLLIGKTALGQEEVELVTRNAHDTSIVDTSYRRLRSEFGETLIIQTNLRGAITQPYTIFASHGTIEVSRGTQYRRGYQQETPAMVIGKNQGAEAPVGAYFAMSNWTSQINMNRGPEESALADNQAYLQVRDLHAQRQQTHPAAIRLSRLSDHRLA